MSDPLEPRDLGKILKETFRLYRGNFLKILAIVAVPSAIAQVIGLLMGPPRVAGHIAEGGKLFVTLLGWLERTELTMLAGSLIMAFSGAALIYAVSQLYLTNSINVGRAYRFALTRSYSLAVASILNVLAVSAMLFTIVGIPFAVVFLVRWMFYTQTASLEKQGPVASLKRSSQVVEDHWWWVVGIFVFMILLGGIALVPSQYLLPEVGRLIVGALVTPLTYLAMILIYFNLRVAKEGYNLGRLSTEIGIKPAAQLSAD